MAAPQIVVAIADNHAIGSKGQIPWHISEDLRHFKAVTMGHPIIMGRRTFESIGRVLPGRLNVIVSTRLSKEDPRIAGKNACVVASLEEAIKVCGDDIPMITGGAGLYKEALPLCDVLHLTRVHLMPEADTFFPDFEDQGFERVDVRCHEADGIRFDFETWKRS